LQPPQREFGPPFLALAATKRRTHESRFWRAVRAWVFFWKEGRKERRMGYNNPNPSQSTTLTASERAGEVRKILSLLREESAEDLERKLTDKARRFVEAKQLEMDLGGQLENISIDAYWWLVDIWAKFA
jgi:hypothetical protein